MRKLKQEVVKTLKGLRIRKQFILKKNHLCFKTQCHEKACVIEINVLIFENFTMKLLITLMQLTKHKRMETLKDVVAQLLGRKYGSCYTIYTSTHSNILEVNELILFFLNVKK